eukprot:1501946-Rhodomonas_salina.1
MGHSRVRARTGQSVPSLVRLVQFATRNVHVAPDGPGLDCTAVLVLTGPWVWRSCSAVFEQAQQALLSAQQELSQFARLS